GRVPVRGARPLLVPRAMGPVDFAFDTLDTEGRALPVDAFKFPTLGALTDETFAEHMKTVAALVPTLKPGDLVIMDNLGSHKGQPVRQAIRSPRANLFFLPKCSPDLNPIEQVFAKLKHLLRKAAAPTLDTVIAAIRELLDAYAAPECANYFANAGYAQA